MNSQDIIFQLQHFHWKKIKENALFQNYQFDLVAERRHLLFVKWYVLVKQVLVLDEQTLKTQLEIFKDINKKSKSLWMGKMFLYIIVSPKIDPSLEPQIKGDNFEILINSWFTMTGTPRQALFIGRIEGGGGNLLAYDTTKRQWYGQIPEIPWDVKKYSEQIKEIIK